MEDRYPLPRIRCEEPRQLISATEVAQGASHNPPAARQQEKLPFRSE